MKAEHLLPLLALAASPARATPNAPPASTPARYADTVLVILNASLTPGETPPGLAVAASTPGVKLERLESASFKNLMPCYEIIVAGGFADKKQAQALAAKLKAAGVDVALKPAGAWLGPRPELARTCAAMRSPPAREEEVLLRAAPGLHLPLDPAVAARALEGAPPVRALSAELDAWSAPLPHRTVGRWTVGQALPGLSHAGATKSCTIQGFVVGVVGTPHFGWVQSGDHSAPSCGSPAVYAKVDCDADLVDMRPGARAAVARGPARPDPAPFGGGEAPWAEVRAAIERGVAHAKAQGARLERSWTVTPLDLGGESLRLVQLRLWTNEGFAACGGEDLLEEWAGVVGPDGAPRSAAHQTTWSTLLGVVQAGAGAPLELHLRAELGGGERLEGGPTAYALDLPFCDCGC